MYTGCLTVRPHQLMCAVCALGEGGDAPCRGRIGEILRAVREVPDRPLAVVANVGDVYVYQDPGTTDDTPEGGEYNRKRDLDILQRMDWPPGIVVPARTAFLCVLKQITTPAGICGYDTVTADAWRGCAKAGSGFYEKGHKLGIGAIVPPRIEDEMARAKEAALAAMRAAAEIPIRPHLLLCAVCQYAGGTRPPFKPDNLPEFLQMVLTDRPDVPVRLVRQADWMMCACCPKRVPALNACVNILGSGGMSNEKRDLDTLQKLGLRFGSVLPARELYRRIFATITTTREICARPGNPSPSVWWDSNCGEANPDARHTLYETGRAELMVRFGGPADG
jgi:hypothetical protein